MGGVLSVIVPTYNRPRDLTTLLNSVLKQTAKPAEVMIVDDSPSPVIMHVFEDYETTFDNAGIMLSYIRNHRERSLPAARSIGVKRARGDIILFRDDDMILYPDYIQRLSETFKEHPHVLGVAGWIIDTRPSHRNIRYYFLETLRKLFLLFHDSMDR